MKPHCIDLYSDTQTRPTPGMRAAMAQAVVGDEQSDEDPTTLQLCEKVADLLGQEAGVFMPSGTMCNLVAILTHTRPGGGTRQNPLTQRKSVRSSSHCQ